MTADTSRLARALIDKWNEGEMEAIYAVWDPDIVIRPDPDFPEGTCFGREAAQRFWESNREMMGGGRLIIEEEHDLGDRCLVRIRQPVHSRSGYEGAYSWSVIVTTRAQKVIMVEFFIDHDKALAALALDPASPAAQ